MAASSDMELMNERLKSHSRCFLSMVELIPAKYYLTRDPEMEETLVSSKYWVNKKSKAPKQTVKDATKRAKRVKFDPESFKSIHEQQKEAESKSLVEDDSTKDSPAPEETRFSVESVRSTQLNDLRERLQIKIGSLKGKRKTREDDPEQFAVKKQKTIEKRKRRKEERMRKNKSASTDTLMKLKPEKARPSIKDESGKLVFSKFDFASKQSKDTKQKSDFQKLLKKAEATEKKLEELKKSDKKRSEELQEKLQWKKAMDLARGTKVKDDPKLIKKSLKRIEKKKSRSEKKWAERNEQEQQRKDKRQDMRKKNIQERIELIKAKRSKKKVKKSKRTPGF